MNTGKRKANFVIYNLTDNTKHGYFTKEDLKGILKTVFSGKSVSIYNVYTEKFVAINCITGKK